jgi:hypothetical protein
MPLRGFLLATLLVATAAGAQEPAVRYADAHVHLVDFSQRGDGTEALLDAMNAGGITDVIVMGIPVMKQWHEDAPKRPRFYQSDEAQVYWYSATDAIVAGELAKVEDRDRQRLHAFVSGINPTDKNSTLHIRRMLDLYPGVFAGIGEIVTRHDDLTTLLPGGEAPRANSEAMMRIYELAAERDLPVLLHSNLTSVREREPLYLPEIEAALANNPRTRIIWAHAGASAEIHRNQGPMKFLRPVIADLLEKHPNLWIDLSWTVLDPYLLDKKGKPRRAWLELIERYPERFVIGSDVVGKFDSLGEKMREFDPLLEALPESVAAGLARENLLRLLGSAH